MKRLMSVTAIVIFVGIISIGGVALAGNTSPDYYVDETALSFEALPGATAYWGVHKGAGYRVEVPDNWNGDLVLYCHGFRGLEDDPLRLFVTDPRIREDLVTNGYAWAASSYSKNDYDVKEGVKDTNALTHFFNGLVGKPNRVYITGHSMGGHITGVAIEQYPKTYDGALPMCGVMADYELFNYFQDYHLVAQYYTGMQVVVPFPADYDDTISDMKFVMGAGSFPYSLTGVGEQFKTAVKYLSGGTRPLYDYGFMYYANFLFMQIIDPDIVGNMDTFYHLDDLLDAISWDEEELNANIYRSEPLPKYVKPNGLANIPVISGDLPIPVITLHTLGDLFVPFSMQQIYAQRVAIKGKSDLLVQRAIRDVGHCSFTPDEEWEAFSDLVDWVENGDKPDGDDILDATAVADPDFGCNFTLVDRPYSAPCPAPPP
jgi:pimeloyl-ACP methyl ester carboxylesterase